MFCSQCNTELPDGAQFCSNCGKSFAVNTNPVPMDFQMAPPLESTPQMSAPQMLQQPVNNMADAGKKKGKGVLIGVLVAVLVVALGAGGFVFYWFNRPIAKVNRELEKEDGDMDIVTENFSKLSNDTDRELVINYFLKLATEENNLEPLNGLYGDLTEEEQETVNEELFSYVNKLYNDYNKGSISEDDVVAVYDNLYEGIFEDNEEFEDIYSNFEDLTISKSDFESGMDAYNSQDYESAISSFEDVIEEDSNYSEAQKLMSECYDNLVPDIEGVWYTSLDLGPTMNNATKMDGLECTLEMDFTFNADMTGSLSINEKSIENGYEMFIMSFEYALIEYMKEQTGYDSSIDYDELAQEFAEYKGYNSISDYCRGSMPYSTFKNKFALTPLQFTYEVDQETIRLYYTSGGSDEYEYSLYGDTLTIYNFAKGDNKFDSLGISDVMDLQKR